MTERLRRSTGRYAGKAATERHAERRRRFLDAGLELFGAGPGYRSTTVAALCEAAGLSTRQFYEEFRTLEDVLAVLHLEVNDYAERAVLDALARTAELPAAERYGSVFRAYAASIAEDPRRIRITFTEIVGVSPRLDEQRLSRRARWIDLIRPRRPRLSAGAKPRTATTVSRRPPSSEASTGCCTTGRPAGSTRRSTRSWPNSCACCWR